MISSRLPLSTVANPRSPANRVGHGGLGLGSRDLRLPRRLQHCNNPTVTGSATTAGFGQILDIGNCFAVSKFTGCNYLGMCNSETVANHWICMLRLIGHHFCFLAWSAETRLTPRLSLINHINPQPRCNKLLHQF
jgi:hypothetical protein